MEVDMAKEEEEEFEKMFHSTAYEFDEDVEIRKSVQHDHVRVQ